MYLEHAQTDVLFLVMPARKPYTDLSTGPGPKPAALACTGTHALSLAETSALERMGYQDPFRVHTLFTPDGGGYDHTAALHRAAKLVEERLVKPSNAASWDARGLLRAWRWWALRDGFVGLPFERMHRFLPKSYWPAGCRPSLPENQGVLVLVLPDRAGSAHRRLAAQGRLLDDLALAIAQDAPHTRVVDTHWIA
jgi:hypothetical protein